jgi:hypothetical protein
MKKIILFFLILILLVAGYLFYLSYKTTQNNAVTDSFVLNNTTENKPNNDKPFLDAIVPAIGAVGNKIQVYGENFTDQGRPLIKLVNKTNGQSFYITDQYSLVNGGPGQLEITFNLPDNYCSSVPSKNASGAYSCSSTKVSIPPGNYNLSLITSSGATSNYEFNIISNKIGAGPVVISSVQPANGSVGKPITLHVSNFQFGNYAEIYFTNQRGQQIYITNTGLAATDIQKGTVIFNLPLLACELYTPEGLKCKFPATLVPGDYKISLIRVDNSISLPLIQHNPNAKSNEVNFQITSSNNSGSTNILPIVENIVPVNNSSSPLKNDQSVKSNIGYIRQEAEIFFDSSSSYAGVCKYEFVLKLFNAAMSSGGNGGQCGSTATTWAAWVGLATDSTKAWCVDNTGSSKQINKPLPITTVLKSCQ